MATFAKATFNAAIYSRSRPTYPQKLFDYIFNYHRNSSAATWDVALDLGCGTGQATLNLRPFRRVLGVDPSKQMLEQARIHIDATLQPDEASKFDFRQGSAEDLRNVVQDRSVDLVIAAQAAHWFDWTRMWPETYRILKPGGTAAFWTYSEFRLPKHLSLSPLITEFMQGNDPETSLGPHFQRPGRTILERHLVDVPNPEIVLQAGEALHNVERVYFSGEHHPALPQSQTAPVIMKKQMRWRDLLEYLRSASALHSYHEAYPLDLARPDDPRFPEDLETTSPQNIQQPTNDIDIRGGDILIRFWKDLREAARNQGGSVRADDFVDVEWPIAMILARKE